MLVLPTIADDHRNFRSLKERSQHQLNWLRLQPAFQINPGHLAQFFDGPRTNALVCKVRESCHRLHIAEDYDGHVLRFVGGQSRAAQRQCPDDMLVNGSAEFTALHRQYFGI